MELASLPISEARTHLLVRASDPTAWMNGWRKTGIQASPAPENAPQSRETHGEIANGQLLRKAGKTTKAISAFQAAIADLEKSPGDGVALGEAHGGLAVTLQESGLWEASVNHYMMAIYELQRQGSRHNAALLVNLYNNLAMICRELGRTDEAELAYVTAIEFHDENLGANAADSLSTIYCNLAYLYHEMGLGSAAFEMQRLATELIKSHSPKELMAQVHGLRRAGIFAATAGKLAPAITCFEEARKLIGTIASAPEDTNTELLINEATACLGLDRNDEALALYERAATAIERRSSPDTLLLALVQNNIGCLFLRQKKYEAAIMRLTQANELNRNHPASDLCSRAEILHNLSLAHQGAGSSTAAKAYQDASLQLLEFVSDETRDKLATARLHLAELPSSSVTRESNLAERAYARTAVLVSTQKKAARDILSVPLRTETIDWL